MSNNADVLVVGGGVIGRLITWALQAEGESVLLIDPTLKTHGSASLAAGAMFGAFAELTADRDRPSDVAEFEFRYQSSLLYPNLLAHLEDVSDRKIFTGSGTFIVGNVNGQQDDRNVQYIARFAEERGVKCNFVEPIEIPGYKPNSRDRSTGAIFLPDEGFVNTADLMAALEVAVNKSQRVQVVNDTVTGLTGDESAVTGVMTSDGKMYSCSQVVLAAGAATQQIVDASDWLSQKLPPLLPGKGVSLLVDSADQEVPHVIRTPNRDFACGTHIVPRGNGTLYVGATNRIAATPGVAGGVTAGEVHNLLHSSVHELNTNIRTMNLLSTTYGSRPLTIDRHPLVGVTDIPGLAIATATYRNGIVMAPLVARVVVDEILGRSPSFVHPFSPIGRVQGLLGGRTPKRDILSEGVRDLVSFIQEPTGSLPYSRSEELERFIKVVMEIAFLQTSEHEDFRSEVTDLLERYPMSEVIPQMFYRAQEVIGS